MANIVWKHKDIKLNKNIFIKIIKVLSYYSKPVKNISSKNTRHFNIIFFHLQINSKKEISQSSIARLKLQ